MSVTKSVVYRYYLTDLLTNEITAEVPFRGVSFSRTNRRAGSFSGSIAFDEATRGLNLYEVTMPGKTGIYVVRNNVCVWGGILWARTYNSEEQELNVDGSEFTSYLYHRNIWKTIQYGSNFIGVFSYEIVSGSAIITTESAHGFAIGDMVRVSSTNSVVNGDYEILSVPSDNQFAYSVETEEFPLSLSTSGACRSLVDTYDFARDLVSQVASDLGGISFSNEIIKPGRTFEVGVVSKEISENIATIRTETEHSIIVGQEIELVDVGSGLDGSRVVSAVPNPRAVQFDFTAGNLPLAETRGIRQFNVLTKQISNLNGILVLDGSHGAVVGQTVFLDGVDSFFTGRLETTFNGKFEITAIPDDRTIVISTGSLINTPVEPVAGGTATLGSKIFYGDYGGFSSNSDIGIQFEGLQKSGFYQDTQVYRGFEQKTVGDILEVYSNVVEGGFEYRIDCDYNYELGKFTRTFKIIPIELEIAPPTSGTYPVEAFGANQLVFEYPGNISSFSVEETAEDSATRFFAVGKVEDLGDEASQPYSAASALDLLNNKIGDNWPVLDQSESLDKVEDEFDLYNYASDYLFESRPPIGSIEVQINGSLEPEIGTYYPGQWCSLVFDDEFIRQRLANDQEPRDDVLIRKISSIDVSISDNPVYPETVKLELVTDWKVDRRYGN